MNELQLFQVLGLALFAMGFGALINPEYYRKLISEYLHTQPIIYLNGVIAIFIGYLLATIEITPISDFTWIIQTLGWITVVKGLLIVVVPSFYLELARSFKSNISLMAFEIFFTLLLGAAMLYIGFGW